MKALRILLCVAVCVAFATNAFAGVDWLKVKTELEANYDLKMTTDEKAAADGGDLDKTAFDTSGFGRARMEGKISSDTGWFAEGQAGFKAELGEIKTWERWLKFGNDSFALRVVTPDSPDAYKKGQDIYIASANGQAKRYDGKNWVKDRGVSVHLDPSDNLSLVTCILYKADGDNNAFGIRPRVELKAGSITAMGSFEYYSANPQDADAKGSSTGYGGGGQVSFNMDPIEVAVGGAYGVSGGKDATDTDLDDEIWMAGIGWMKFAMGAGKLGAGAFYSTNSYDKAKDEKTGLQAYVSYEQGSIMGVDGLTLCLGASYATTEDKPDGGTALTNTAMGGRIRIKYGMGSQSIIGE